MYSKLPAQPQQRHDDHTCSPTFGTCGHDNVNTTDIDWRKISEEFTCQGQGHFLKGSRSHTNVMSYSVADTESPSQMASHSSYRLISTEPQAKRS